LPLEDFDRLSTAENNRLGVAYFTGGQYFGAHEAWETCWKQAAGTPEEEGFKGLAQLAAGYVHLQRGNPSGCRVLLRRAIGRLSRAAAHWQSPDTARLIADAEAVLSSMEP
jgi:predicted metal-dependent hydrolase